MKIVWTILGLLLFATALAGISIGLAVLVLREFRHADQLEHDLHTSELARRQKVEVPHT